MNKSSASFAVNEKIIEGWYWGLKASNLGLKKALPLNFLGKELVVYRGASGRVVAMDAFCPHMGAHLAEGTVEGDRIKCLFHCWEFGPEGACEKIPCLPKPVNVSVKTHHCEEKYGLVWIWAGEGEPSFPVPYVPELENTEVDSMIGGFFVKNCHPHVVMINAIDAQHFASVHNLPVKLSMEPTEFRNKALVFANSTPVPKTTLLLQFISKFYANALTYALSYWNGSNGTVTLGPDFLHFHIMFALRPTVDGKTEGVTLLITKGRKGWVGKSVSTVLLWATWVVGKYFAKGDTKIFRTIKFNFATPIGQDAAILRFVQHVEKMPTLRWGWGASSVSSGGASE